MSEIINSTEIDELASKIEEAARATGNTERFIEPAPGTLRRATTKRHHLVFGRRGSGKSSLLSKAASDLKNLGRPVAFIDLEPFKGNYYPDVLLSVLIRSLSSFHSWIRHSEETLPQKVSLKQKFIKLFTGKSKPPASDLAKELGDEIQALHSELEKILHLADNVELEQSIHATQEDTQQASVQAKIGIPADIGVGANASETSKALQAAELKEKFTRSKIDFLHRKVLHFQDVFIKLSRLSGGDAFLFLDDLYHIKRQDQAQLLDYFHRIAKGSKLWLKVGTVRRRSQWYKHANPPVGMKLGDDADEINLDVTLETFSVVRKFLVTILEGFIEETGAPDFNEFMAEGAIERLVLASGGVARDFLGIFRGSIDATRERVLKNPAYYRGPKIGAEDVNIAVGIYGEVKLEEFERDSLEDKEKLESVFKKVVNFCLRGTNSNCFLLDQTLNKTEEYELIEELVDLRLIHLIKSRVTVKSDRAGEVYRAYMLDLSQYAGARVKRDLNLIKFWQSPDELRRASLIYV